MKKIFIAVSSALISTILFVSCKKDNSVPPPSVVGYWNGKFGIGSTNYPNKGYSFLFRNDGTVRIYHLNFSSDTAAVHKGEGTYTVIGNQVKTNYNLLIYDYEFSTAAVIDAQFTFIEGTWGTGANPNNGGKYLASKQ